MTERILVPLPDGRWFALDREAFDAALEAGTARMQPAAKREAASPATEKLLSAEQLASATGVPASWYASQARERRIPFRKIGRYVRFDLNEVMASDALKRREIPAGQMNCTDSYDRKGRANA